MTAPRAPQGMDPTLIGIWVMPGQPFTYEVEADGTYHVAAPEEPLTFEAGGAVMVWGSRRHERVAGAGATPVGSWRETRSGDTWRFEADGAYAVTAPDGAADSGIWALRDGGESLWTRELRARIETDGAHLTFHTVFGETTVYGYTLQDGLWRMHDPRTWIEQARLVSAETLLAEASG